MTLSWGGGLLASLYIAVFSVDGGSVSTGVDGRTEDLCSIGTKYPATSKQTQKKIWLGTFKRGTQREYSSKPLKHSIVDRILVIKR